MSAAEGDGNGQDADRRRMAWLKAAQMGDGAAYAALLRDCVPVIQAAVRGHGVPARHADDVVQDVMLTMHCIRHTYDPARSFTAWLHVIAQQRTRDLMRRHGRQQARELHAPLAYDGHPDPTPDPAQALQRSRRAGMLRAAVSALPVRQREAVEQVGPRERRFAEAAGATDRTTGALKVSLHRAFKVLRIGLPEKE